MIDVHTHLHPPRLTAAIRRWFAEHSTWVLRHPTEPREVARLLREAEEQATSLISSHRHELDELVKLLMDKETVDGAAVYRLLGKPVPAHQPDGQTVAPRAAAAADQAGHGSAAGG